MRKRIDILKDLAEHHDNVSKLKEELSHYQWDCDQPLFKITVKEINKVLTKYIENIINAKELEDWANAIECRDDLDFENNEIEEIIIKLANPVLYENITIVSIERILRHINS